MSDIKYLFILLLLFSGCDKSISPKSDLPENFVCTKDQQPLVDWQFSMCMKTGYTASYCQVSSMKSNCSRKP